jgi:hypothetical protein
MAIYSYCLIRPSSDEALPSLSGIDHRPVFPVRCDKYTMLLSRLERDFPFSARSIVEHGQVIARLFENHTVLPMRFGTFFRSEKQIAELIRENRQELLEAFCRLRGKAEMRLKLLFHFAPRGEVRKAPQRAMGVEECFSNGESEPLDPQCREMAAQMGPRLRELFHPLDQQVTCRRLEDSQLLVDCAHLIESHQVGTYQKLCCTASGQVKDCAIRMSGPWPPYHFLPSSVRLPAVSATVSPLRTRLPVRMAAAAR